MAAERAARERAARQRARDLQASLCGGYEGLLGPRSPAAPRDPTPPQAPAHPPWEVFLYDPNDPTATRPVKRLKVRSGRLQRPR